jgi:hypothetical protein
MDALQCPRCPVRFRFASELRDHLEHDHPGFRARPTDATEDLLDACHCNHGHPTGRGLSRPDRINNAA